MAVYVKVVRVLGSLNIALGEYIKRRKKRIAKITCRSSALSSHVFARQIREQDNVCASHVAMLDSFGVEIEDRQSDVKRKTESIFQAGHIGRTTGETLYHSEEIRRFQKLQILDEPRRSGHDLGRQIIDQTIPRILQILK